MAQQDRQDITGGKGRRDEVGHTGIYPATGPHTEGDIPVRTPGDINDGRPGGAAVEHDEDLKNAERLPRKGDDELD